MSELGQELRRLRRLEEMNLCEVADPAGISISRLSKIEQGKEHPARNELRRLLDSMGLNGHHFDDLSKLLPAPEMPICPYCEKEMWPVHFVGYYDEMHYWECNCEEIPEAVTEEGWWV